MSPNMLTATVFGLGMKRDTEDSEAMMMLELQWNIDGESVY